MHLIANNITVCLPVTDTPCCHDTGSMRAWVTTPKAPKGMWLPLAIRRLQPGTAMEGTLYVMGVPIAPHVLSEHAYQPEPGFRVPDVGQIASVIREGGVVTKCKVMHIIGKTMLVQYMSLSLAVPLSREWVAFNANRLHREWVADAAGLLTQQ